MAPLPPDPTTHPHLPNTAGWCHGCKSWTALSRPSYDPADNFVDNYVLYGFPETAELPALS